MSTRLLAWFEKRRKSKTLEIAQLQMTKAIDTVSELEKTLNAFCEGYKEKAKKHIEKLFQQEIEIDELRRTVFDELTKGDLPTKYREDLKSLVGRLDRMADAVKDSARSIKILIEAEATVPKEILDLNLKIAKKLVKSTSYLHKSLETLGIDPSQAREYTLKVDAYEGLIDEDHLSLQIMFIKKASMVNAPTLMILMNLAEAMELASDMCDDTADYIRTLAIAET